MGAPPRPKEVIWLNDRQWSECPPNFRALHAASAMDGLREVPENHGVMVERFLAAVGLPGGPAWCAAFVYERMLVGGVDPKSLPAKWKSAAVWRWEEWAKDEHRLLINPTRGCLFFWLNNRWQGHMGFVRDASQWPVRVLTIEGNTNKRGSRDGDGVYRRDRTLKELSSRFRFGFIETDGLPAVP